VDGEEPRAVRPQQIAIPHFFNWCARLQLVFAASIGGANPVSGLIADSNGNLYGTTQNGGASGRGVVFKLTTGGIKVVLYAFTGGDDGADPTYGSLIADSAAISMARQVGAATRDVPAGSDAAWCSSSRRAGPRRCSTPSAGCLAAATGVIP
jgi:uncharacterized repeat protein (TIGR03803 family)